MNREIKFRGLNENGKWLYGGVLFFKDGTAIMPDGEENEKMITSPVNKETIGQFICLKDKNDIDIYNGDILKDLKGRFYKVFPVRGGFAINIHADDFHKESALFYESTADQQTSGFISGNCEIIGNIHQNPELLNK